MTMNDERLRIVKLLRGLDADDLDDGEFYDRGEVEDALGLVADDGAWYEAAGVRRLADVMGPEERTCRDDGSEDAFRCSQCGAFALRDAVTDLCGSIPIRFCPNCGAKVAAE